MNVNEDFTGSFDNDNDVLTDGDNNARLEIDSENAEEIGEETETETESVEGVSSSGDIEERLQNIESAITNIENYQSSIIDTLEVMEYSNTELLGVNVNMFYLMVGVSIACFFMIIYNWINNFIK